MCCCCSLYMHVKELHGITRNFQLGLLSLELWRLSASSGRGPLNNALTSLHNSNVLPQGSQIPVTLLPLSMLPAYENDEGQPQREKCLTQECWSRWYPSGSSRHTPCPCTNSRCSAWTWTLPLWPPTSENPWVPRGQIPCEGPGDFGGWTQVWAKH